MATGRIGRASLGQLAALLATIGFLSAGATGAHAGPDESIEAIKKAGGKVERDDAAADKPVVAVYLAGAQEADAALTNLTGLDAVRKVTLNGSKITDVGLAHLANRPALRKIYLVDTKITDAGLDHLKGLADLEIVSLVGTEVTDAGLEKLKGLAKLQTVFLAATKVTDAGVKTLQDALPMLKIIR